MDLISKIIIASTSGILLCIPLMFWMYICTSFPHARISRIQFIIWTIAGGVVTLPLIFHHVPLLFHFTQLVFSPAWELSPWLSALFISFSTIFLSSLVVWTGIIILVSIFRRKIDVCVSLYVFSLAWICAVSVVLLFLSYILSRADFSIQASINLWYILIATSGGIILYYIMIALFEEYAKYLWSMGMTWAKQYRDIKVFLLVAVSVALWFSCLENILYFIVSAQASFDWSLLMLAFWRSAFSLSVHMCSSLLVALWFWYLVSPGSGWIKKMSTFFLFALLWIFSHSFFDIALTYEKLGVVLLYFVILYIFISFISHRDLSKGESHSAL